MCLGRLNVECKCAGKFVRLLEHSGRLLVLDLLYIVIYIVTVVIVYCTYWENIYFEWGFFFSVMLSDLVWYYSIPQNLIEKR